MPPSSRRTPRYSKNRGQEISPTSEWFVIQVEPGGELEAARLVQTAWRDAGLSSPQVIPSPQKTRSRRHAELPYQGLIFVSDERRDDNQLQRDDALALIENLNDPIRGVLYQAENVLIEFEGLKVDDGSGSVNEAITQLNKLALREMRFEGQASMFIGEAKSYTPGERGREVLNTCYFDMGLDGLPEQSDFIEARMYLSAYHRDLLRDIPGVVGVVGGDAPLCKRGAALKPAELEPVKVSGEVIASFAQHRYQLYVVQTQSQNERGVVDTLLLHRAEDQEALLCGERVRMFINQTRLISQGDGVGLDKKKFGYIYVSVNLDSTSWHLIKSIPKVSGFVGGKTINEVRPLSPDESDMIFASNEKESAAIEATPQQADYTVGEVVEVTDGPFISYRGQVQEVNVAQKTMQILIDDMSNMTLSSGRGGSGFSSGLNISTDVGFSQVQKIT